MGGRAAEVRLRWCRSAGGGFNRRWAEPRSKAVEGWSSSRRRSVQAGACPRGWMGSRAAEVRGADVQAEASIGKRAERRRRPWRHGVAAGDLNQLYGGGVLPDFRSCLPRLSSLPPLLSFLLRAAAMGQARAGV